MKNLIKSSIVAGSIAGTSYLSFQAGVKKENEMPLVQRSLAHGPRYIAFNKQEFVKKPGSMSALGVDGSAMPNINGFVLNAKPKTSLGNDWEIQEEKIYTIRQGCAPNPGGNNPTPTPPCASPTPSPTPTPPCTGGNCGTPEPTPPPSSSEFLWWSKQVGADIAQSKVSTSDVVVCVLDTGIDQSHPELSGMIAGGKSMLGGSYQDDQGHGTHVAGIIAAKNGNGGISGVSQSKVYMVKVLDRQGSGMSSWIANGIVECVNQGHMLISMSLGGDTPDSIIKQAVDYAVSRGATIIAAAGNNGGRVGYPAGYSNVIAVSALDRNNRLASFSARGPEIDLAGYGVDIVSLRLGGGTTSMSGTSMATPGVAGVFAFAKKMGRPVKTINLGLDPNQQGIGLAHAGETTK